MAKNVNSNLTVVELRERYKKAKSSEDRGAIQDTLDNIQYAKKQRVPQAIDGDSPPGLSS